MPKPSQCAEQQLQSAVDAVRRGMSKRNAAKMFFVPRSTLGYRLSGKFGKSSYGPTPVLTPEEEEKLTQWILECGKWGFPRRKTDLQRSVQALLKKSKRPNPFTNDTPGRKWYHSFLKRHPSIVQKMAGDVRQPNIVQKMAGDVSRPNKVQKMAGDVSRPNIFQKMTGVVRRSNNVQKMAGDFNASLTESSIRSWFEKVRELLRSEGLEEILLDPSRIFNCDEFVAPIHPLTGEVLALKNSRSVYEVDKTCITAMCAFSADGSAVSPCLIYPYNSRISAELVQSVPNGWNIGQSENGRMNGEAFFNYIKYSFHPFLVKNNSKRPVILFLDGHKSQLTEETTELCKELKIVLVALYADSIRLIRPYDVGVLPQLKCYLKVATMDFENSGEVVRKESFAPVFGKAYKMVAENQEALRNAFKSCGIYPFSPHSIDFSKLIEGRVKSIDRNMFELTLGEDLMNKIKGEETSDPALIGLKKLYSLFGSQEEEEDDFSLVKDESDFSDQNSESEEEIDLASVEVKEKSVYSDQSSETEEDGVESGLSALGILYDKEDVVAEVKEEVRSPEKEATDEEVVLESVSLCGEEEESHNLEERDSVETIDKNLNISLPNGESQAANNNNLRRRWRENQRNHRRRIKENSALYEQEKAKERKRWHRRKQQIKLVSDLEPEELVATPEESRLSPKIHRIPMTPGERQRKYRERMKQDPIKTELVLRKMRERARFQRENGIVPKIGDMSERGKRKQRAEWRKRQRKRQDKVREKKAHAIEDEAKLPITEVQEVVVKSEMDVDDVKLENEHGATEIKVEVSDTDTALSPEASSIQNETDTNDSLTKTRHCEHNYATQEIQDVVVKTDVDLGVFDDLVEATVIKTELCLQATEDLDGKPISPVTNITGNQKSPKTNSVKISLKCKFCYCCFPVEEFKSHLETHKTENNTHDAPVTVSENVNKVKNGGKRNKTEFQCVVCNKMMPLFKLAAHMRFHSKFRECPECHMLCSSKTKFSKHVENHRKVGFFDCPKCDKRYSAKASLKHHMIMSHSTKIRTPGPKRFECDFCLKKFEEKTNIVKHMRSHTGETPFECSFCIKAFSHKCNLQAHMRIHTKETPFECRKCRPVKKYNDHSALRRHMVYHSGVKRFECGLCGKKCSRKDHLRSHIATHEKS